mmetsp:Transcript_52004/g.101839  ORF Transcript_52004/g.101839 Transcript_52004/m.101839 type:complete len:124 (-) Transcript_52004:1519-1890(-)
MHAGVPVWLALLRAGLKGHRSICLNIWANRVKYTILACLSDRRDRCTMQPFWIHHAWRCTGGQIEFTDAREHAVSLSQQQQRTALNTHTHTHTHTHLDTHAQQQRSFKEASRLFAQKVLAWSE